MGRNAAFGRPLARDRFRLWWYARSRASRVNAVLVLAVGGAVLALMAAATSRDATRSKPLANATRPQLTAGSIVPTPSTVAIGELTAAAGPAPPADLFGLGSTTTSTVAAAPTVPGPAPARAATPTTAATATPATTVAPATTVPNPNIVFTEVPGPDPSPTTTTLVTLAPVPTTAPPTTATTTPPTTTPPTTTPPTTASPTTTAPGLLPPVPPLF